MVQSSINGNAVSLLWKRGLGAAYRVCVITSLYLDSALTEYVKATTLVLDDTITQQTTNSKNALQVYLWITKALVLRTHPLGYELTTRVIEWCGNNTAPEAPQGFDILIGDDELALNKDTFATTTVRIMQRLEFFVPSPLILTNHSIYRFCTSKDSLVSVYQNW